MCRGKESKKLFLYIETGKDNIHNLKRQILVLVKRALYLEYTEVLKGDLRIRTLRGFSCQAV